MNYPLSTATLRNPGRVNNLQQLHHLVSMGNHVPLWVHKSMAGHLLAAHGNNNMIVPHPGVPIPMPQQQQQPQGFAAGGEVGYGSPGAGTSGGLMTPGTRPPFLSTPSGRLYSSNSGFAQRFGVPGSSTAPPTMPGEVPGSIGEETEENRRFAQGGVINQDSNRMTGDEEENEGPMAKARVVKKKTRPKSK